MTIQDAVKTGKPFRRISSSSIDGRWILTLFYCFSMEDSQDMPGIEYPSFSAEDILADDWEVREC